MVGNMLGLLFDLADGGSAFLEIIDELERGYTTKWPKVS
jgi:hypothetical protein